MSRALTLTLAAIGVGISATRATAPESLAWLTGVGSRSRRSHLTSNRGGQVSNGSANQAPNQDADDGGDRQAIEEYERLYIWQLLDRYADNRELAPLLR